MEESVAVQEQSKVCQLPKFVALRVGKCSQLESATMTMGTLDQVKVHRQVTGQYLTGAEAVHRQVEGQYSTLEEEVHHKQSQFKTGEEINQERKIIVGQFLRT